MPGRGSKRGRVQDGVYEHRGPGQWPLVHALEVRLGLVVRAWVYCNVIEYRSDGTWEASVLMRQARDLDLSGYRRQVWAGQAVRDVGRPEQPC